MITTAPSVLKYITLTDESLEDETETAPFRGEIMKFIGFKDVEAFAQIIEADASGIGDNVHVVVAEMPDQQGIMQYFIGLEKAQEIAEEDKNNLVILTSFVPLTFLATRKHFHEAMADPRVLFIRLPFSAEDLRQALKDYETNPRPADELAKHLGHIKRTNNALSMLQHDGRYLVDLPADDSRKKHWLDKANVTLGDGSFDELWAKLKGQVPSVSSSLSGMTFPDVCVDIEGTLFTPEGVLRTEVLETVKAYETTNPITVWTGGDIEKLDKLLRRNNILWKVLPKEALRGATVEIIIDDLPQTEFFEQYGVNCATYIQV